MCFVNRVYRRPERRRLGNRRGRLWPASIPDIYLCEPIEIVNHVAIVWVSSGAGFVVSGLLFAMLREVRLKFCSCPHAMLQYRVVDIHACYRMPVRWQTMPHVLDPEDGQEALLG
jgi:hypothetical protein